MTSGGSTKLKVAKLFQKKFLTSLLYIYIYLYNILWNEGVHPVGILSGKEDYSVLQTAGKDLFQEINELIAAGKINVNGREITLEFYLGGDYKVRDY